MQDCAYERISSSFCVFHPKTPNPGRRLLELGDAPRPGGSEHRIKTDLGGSSHARGQDGGLGFIYDCQRVRSPIQVTVISTLGNRLNRRMRRFKLPTYIYLIR